ncbi:TraB/GumN family protein [Leptolyngbya iicbica]|uniref:TraB/GumN family protein n=2 Tax=Cyanophyceae TaxID=3028117 RepID=A0A4Q7E213_9CYAN|nr:TraB/GumN family protein [Leptolyngbya sp. LK]RZM75016.1 TraB/GumN family protein [Leptolyngbya sp. LK]
MTKVWHRYHQSLPWLLGLGLLSGLAIAPRPNPVVVIAADPAIATLEPMTALEPTAETDEQFLWQIETPTNTVYLLGSIHFLDADSYPLPEVMQAAFSDAEKLVLEADVGPGTEAEVAALLWEAALPEPGESLTDVLDVETYGLAAQRVNELGLSIQMFEPFEPWFLAVSLTAFELISLGFTPEYGVDQHFYQQAQANGKPILFLETAEQQFDLFEQLSIAEQRLFTEQTLAELDLFEDSFNEIVGAWETGDRDHMAEILLTSFADYPEMQAIFLSDRNRDWVNQILPWLESDEDYLIVVGALHLVGPDNVLDLLAAAGYEAEQL